jgi:hypothetical protein
MTLVVGEQFGNRLVVLSDTMIADSSSVRSNIIPGQLKTVVLSTKLSVSFAGRVSPGLGVIRTLRSQLADNFDIEMVLESLCTETLTHNGEVEFLVASRIPSPALYKISNGQKFSGSSRYWIGDPEGASTLQRIIDTDYNLTIPDQEHCTAAESKLWLAFMDLVSERQTPGVGGLPVFCLGSPEGFCYQNHAGTYSYGIVNIPETKEQQELRLSLERTGIGPSYSYAVTTSPHRGTATIGGFFPQADTGYLYSPIDCDQPTKFYPIDLNELQRRVNADAERWII